MRQWNCFGIHKNGKSNSCSRVTWHFGRSFGNLKRFILSLGSPCLSQRNCAWFWQEKENKGSENRHMLFGFFFAFFGSNIFDVSRSEFIKWCFLRAIGGTFFFKMFEEISLTVDCIVFSRSVLFMWAFLILVMAIVCLRFPWEIMCEYRTTKRTIVHTLESGMEGGKVRCSCWWWIIGRSRMETSIESHYPEQLTKNR